MSALLQPLSLALAISIYAPCSDEVSNIRLCSTLLKVVTSCDYVPNYIVPSNSHFMNPTKTKIGVIVDVSEIFCSHLVTKGVKTDSCTTTYIVKRW
jgi:hypothetical protein